jgi:hypothetical protein
MGSGERLDGAEARLCRTSVRPAFGGTGVKICAEPGVRSASWEEDRTMTMTMSADQLVDVMEEVADSFRGTVSVAETLPRITASAVANVPGAEHASISIRRADGVLETLAPTCPLARAADKIHYRLREGPC